MANFRLIKEISRQKGIPVRHLADAVGISENQLHHLVKKGSTNTVTLEAIAKHLEVPIGIFFDEISTSDPVREKLLEKEIELLRRLLDEKERTIKILIDKQR